MGVEVVGFEKAPSPVVEADNNSVSHDKENGKPGEHISFGSQENDSAKGEENKVSEANYPKDAVDEWPEHKIHNFYFVRCRPLDDPKTKAKMDNADKEIVRWSQARFKTIEKLKAKRSERGEIISQLKPLDVENKQFNIMVDEKRREMEPLQQALGKLRTANTAGRGSGLCSSEEELNVMIHGLNYRIQHESIPLSEEKQILREIKQLEGTREKVIANAAMRTKLQDSLGQKDVIQDQVKHMGVDLDGVRKDQQAIKGRIKSLRDELERIDADIKTLQDELTEVTEKKDKAYENMQELRKMRGEGNTLFFENRTLMNKVRDLAAKKDVNALQELSHLEVERFMSSWSSNKGFRNDYEKRLPQSLDGRQMSKDGRSRNPDEKPLVAVENPTPQAEAVAKVNPKKTKEEPKAEPKKEAASAPKAQKEAGKKAPEPEIATEVVESVTKDSTGSKKSAKEPEVEKVDPEKLKEMKREEQIAKAKQAMERKKKLAEKNAAKAAAKAQKEAEKKLKDREKKLKKKAGSAAPATDSEEQAEEVTEQEADPTPEAPAPVKEKVQKEKAPVKYRGRLRGSESIPKVIPRRKKSMNYWVYAAPAAAALVLLLLALGYQYFA